MATPKGKKKKKKKKKKTKQKKEKKKEWVLGFWGLSDHPQGRPGGGFGNPLQP
jgi:hypothetical protein